MAATVTNNVSSSDSSKDCYKPSSSTVSQLPYPGLHPYSPHLNWHLHRPPRQYPHNYYHSNSYYKNWFSNYKEQWRQHWQKFRGNLRQSQASSTLPGGCKSCESCESCESCVRVKTVKNVILISNKFKPRDTVKVYPLIESLHKQQL